MSNEQDAPQESSQDSPQDSSPCGDGGCGCEELVSGLGNERLPPDEQSRRGWLVKATYIISGFAAVVTGVPILGFLTGPLRRSEDQWTEAGDVDQFPVGETRLVDLKNPLRKSTDGDTGKVAVYVRHLGDGEFKVLSVYCTHLGCPVTWFSEAGLFMCPCHGGAYYDDGSRASGPPPRGLYEYSVRVDKGKLLVKLGHLPTLSDPA